MDDLGCFANKGTLPDFLLEHIDWQGAWDSEFTHDYFTIESNGLTHFFSRNF
ncbi:MAG: Uncharacterised protein [Prochlorococcus marinus str. MIT 9313]|nr:MAG: Uncharacterised protein [Prochlorococcus marinus str. MIT 9313]